MNLKKMDDDLYSQICTYENLELAFNKAKKGKTLKTYVISFEKHLKDNLTELSNELLFHTYQPQPLKTFIIRDPKTRKISKSAFRDRIIHHALCNIIEPILNKIFIYDSYANIKSKGTLKAIERFDYFKRKVSKDNTLNLFVLKADIKHYFDTVNHNRLLSIINKRIKCYRTIWLIKTILNNYSSGEDGIGMPLGNLTSQFFANVYLNELDQFVKHQLKAKYYLRYVDDFVILSRDKKSLSCYQQAINQFLQNQLGLELHPDKSKIIFVNSGINFLGFRLFNHHRLVRKKNLHKFNHKFNQFMKEYSSDQIEPEIIFQSLNGWLAYVKHANTYKYRQKLINLAEKYFIKQTSPITSLSLPYSRTSPTLL